MEQMREQMKHLELYDKFINYFHWSREEYDKILLSDALLALDDEDKEDDGSVLGTIIFNF